jgi:hypothetical protein
MGVIYKHSKALCENMFNEDMYKDGIPELSDLSEEKKAIILNIATTGYLFEAQKFFWERLIRDEEVAKKLEKILFEKYEEVTGVNGIAAIKTINDYIESIGQEGEAMFFGSFVLKSLKLESAILMMEINSRFSKYLLTNFFETLKNIWEKKNFH